MKKLTKIRLINWHYFSNQTIEIKNNTLLTGQNATGKSTILDALQFVLTAGDQGFNMAAHDHGARSLKGYICCKLGLDNQEYLRQGDVSSHISLELYDDVAEKYYTIGTVIDYRSDVDVIKNVFYLIDTPMKEEYYVENDVVRSIASLKKSGLIENIYQTKREAKVAYRNLFGNVNERFFTLISKALAFKPINNVKDFIYQYLLEEKKIDVESIQDSIRMYKELESTLKLIKRKIDDLEKINQSYRNVVKYQDKTTIIDLLTMLTSISEDKIKIEKLQADIKKSEVEYDRLVVEKKNITNTIDLYEERARVLYSQLLSNDAFKNKEQLDGQIKRMKSELEVHYSKQNKFMQTVNANNAVLDAYLRYGDAKPYRKLRGMSFDNINSENFNDIKNKVLAISNDLDERAQNVYNEMSELNQLKKEKSKEYERAVNAIKGLEGRRLSYNPNVVNLRNEINQRLEKLGTDERVNVLAELIEIDDRQWADAIENYLGGQRFTLIIGPKYFDFALNVFDEIKSKMQVYGVGLVNTKKLDESFDKCDQNSLASIISSNNLYAKRFINMALGHVIMCKNVQQLENYKTAITKESMLYSSFTVRQVIARDKPYIGRNAVTYQMNHFKAEERRLHQEYVDLDNKLKAATMELDLIRRLNLKGFIESMAINLTVETQEKMIKEIENQSKNTVSKSFDDLQKEYDDVQSKRREYSDKLQVLSEQIGRVTARIEQATEEVQLLSDKISERQERFANLKNENLSLENEVYLRFNEDSKEYKNTADLLNKYIRDSERNKRNINLSIDELKALQLAYNNEYNFDAIIGIESIKTYLDEYDKLYKSNLVEYEDKVHQARLDTERLFKEDFIAKLRNNILLAQDGVKKINQALENVRFGNDKYEFIFPKNQEFSAIYDMVLNDDDMLNNGPIITMAFEEKYKEELSILFDNLAVDEINSEGAITKFTDYRTYMDYDIKITNENGDVTYFSKVFKEKSGGETQVPFYISIIASFVQLYSNSKSSIGLILFDEAFDKMDSNRIRKMMEFINELDLQIFIAATPQKMESISRFVDTTLVVHHKGLQSYVYQKINKKDVLN